jgi:GntR family transcriptional regulator, trigonelline degradation regulator
MSADRAVSAGEAQMAAGATDRSAYRVAGTTTTTRERTVAALRKAILDMHFRPGDRLIERELCDLTGVSRTSLREALRHLEAEGLVQNVPHKGTVVASVTPDDARQIYEVRGAIEGLAGRLFTERARPREVADLAAAAKRYEDAIRKRDVDKVLAALTDFYGIIFDGCGNPLAATMIRSLRARMQYLRTTTTLRHTDADTRRSIENFRRIVAAVRAKDPDRAAAACVAQVEHAAAVAMEVLKSEVATG